MLLNRCPTRFDLKNEKDYVELALSAYNFPNDIPNLKHDTFDVVDFFSGCGGMSYGFKLIGDRTGRFRHVGAFEIDVHANKTFKKNFNSTPFCVDLEKVRINEIMAKIGGNRSGKKNPLIVIGCAPCQGFSSHRKKDPRKDARNTLVGIFAEIAVQIDAKFIIMENVPDLLAEKHWKHCVEFRNIVEKSGYNVSTAILNMAHFGVPQERHRAVILASKEFIPSMPKKIFRREEFRTVRDAMGSLPTLEAGGVDMLDPMHQTSNHRKSTVELLSKIPIDGGSRPYGLGPECLDKVAGFYDVYGRLFWDKPAVTITARCRTPSCGRYVHPEQDRGLSVREAALLQGFPETYVFEGPFDDKFKQIGNAVPPIFSTLLASHVLSMMAGQNHANKDHWEIIEKPVAKSYSSVIAMIKQKAEINKIKSK